MDYQALADKALQGLPLDRDECRGVLRASEDSVLGLLEAAFRVRRTYFGRRVRFHLLINAKSGLCPEDCAYCSQSAASEATIDRYPLLEGDKIVQGAHLARAAGATRYCIVTSGRAPGRGELRRLREVVGRIKQELDIEICTSLGFLTEAEARSLKQAGVDRYNHNLNASEGYYHRICATHSYQDRITTLRNAREAGLQLCCGALLGMGESEDDIIDLAFALREVAPDSLPVNFLNPIQGTPLEGVNHLSPVRCLGILSLMRFLNPSREIRLAGGREYHLRSLQPLALYPANSVFVSGYLTTTGQTPDEVRRMVADMGFEVEQEVVEEVATDL